MMHYTNYLPIQAAVSSLQAGPSNATEITRNGSIFTQCTSDPHDSSVTCYHRAELPITMTDQYAKT